MQTCPTCGKQTEGVNHNGRGLRCTFCFARLPEVQPPAAGVSGSWVPAEPKPEPAPTGPDASALLPARTEARPELEKGKRR